jgi:hypothetical protein
VRKGCAARLCDKAVRLSLADPHEITGIQALYEADFVLSESKGESARPMVAQLYVLLLHHLAI